MYGYEKHFDISAEQVLQKITQEQIFEWILEQEFKIGNRYRSTLREDRNPNCRFETREDNTIVFVDFGERLLSGHTHRTCFRMVMDKYGVDLDGAVRLVCKHFNLSENGTDYNPVTPLLYNKEVSDNEKPETVIKYDKRDYNKLDTILWSQWIIKPEHLIEDHVYACNQFSVNKGGKYKVIRVYKYCYAIDFLDKVKIYQPLSAKYKWITNCTQNNIGNFDNLPMNGPEVIIQKSYKDHRILRNLDDHLNVIWFMNEGCVPDMSILKNISERFDLITIFFDATYDGILAALKLYHIFESIRLHSCRIIHLPISSSRNKIIYKDPGELVSKEGRADLCEALKYIGLWHNT